MRWTAATLVVFLCACSAIIKFKDPPDRCGDGVRQSWEQCDGPDLGPDTCQDHGFGPGILSCRSDCTYEFGQCGGSEHCGNGAVDPGEECDGGELNGQDCLSQDYTGGTLGCHANCTFDVSGCTGTPLECGDSYCDTARGENHDNCDTDCNSVCSNGTCDIGHGENLTGGPNLRACPQDCSWIQISAGWNHTCGVKVDHSTWCWGDNSRGQLGDGTNAQSSVPVEVTNSMRFTQISAGREHTCAVSEQRDVWCWGRNNGGQLGNGNAQDTNTPSPVIGLPGVTQVSAGYGFTCAAREDGTAFCWGFNDQNQLGIGNVTTAVCDGRLCENTPQEIQFSGWVHEISTNMAATEGDRSHACAVVDNRAWCWGRNNEGELGCEPGTEGSLPRMLADPPSVSSVAAGDRFTCAVDTSGVLCWGSDEYGTLGEGPGTIDPTWIPQMAHGEAPDVLSAGQSHACFILMNGHLSCWGRNDNGEVGVRGAGFWSAPTEVTPPEPTAFVGVSAGGDHTCAWTDLGRAFCWGSNSHGQIGDGTFDSHDVPPPDGVKEPDRRWSSP